MRLKKPADDKNWSTDVCLECKAEMPIIGLNCFHRMEDNLLAYREEEMKEYDLWHDFKRMTKLQKLWHVLREKP